ncbi:hypothetical protein ZIOFF_044134 [Zingiber officinale]|uniref:Remorin C-terminal domain-containing protein n=1 Tax=Zingiber officinale TaxID=94328 RepID=A0A8J5FWN5_ZINOF|nr:hypothetical protein ZIOFF_044134 [Zingiber officinale]
MAAVFVPSFGADPSVVSLMTTEKAAVEGSTPESAPLLLEPVLKDVEEAKAPIVPAPEERPKFSKLLADAQNHEELSADSRSTDRGAILARALTEKRLSLIKAWEENEKVESENKAVKKVAEIVAWENSKKAEVEAKQKKKEAIAEAKQGKEVMKVEEKAAKYRSTGLAPRKIWGFLGRCSFYWFILLIAQRPCYAMNVLGSRKLHVAFILHPPFFGFNYNLPKGKIARLSFVCC